MRILFLNPCGQLGGAERCLLDTLASLREAEPAWNLHLIAAEDGPLLQAARQLGVETGYLPFPDALARLGGWQPRLRLGIFCLQAVPALLLYRVHLRAAIRRSRPDIIHSNGLKMHLLAAWNERRAPVIWHLHDYVSRPGIWQRSLQRSARRCAGAIAVSQSVASDARRMLGDRVTVKTMLNGVDLQRFHPAGPRLAWSAGLAARQPVRIGLVATFARWKGHEVFLRAVARAAKDVDLHAYVVGGPIYQTSGSQHSLPELQALAAELGVERRVTFTGFLPDPAAAMRALDIVVHASTAPEPFGLVIAEAMACGRPVIAAVAGGAEEVLWDGRTGIGTPPGDVDALAAAMVFLARDGIARMCMGRAARVVAETRFNRARLGPALSSFYRELACAREETPALDAASTAASTAA